MNTPWPVVKLGEVLDRSEETITLLADTEYREVTVRLWGKGVVLRGTVVGAGIAASRRFVAKAGQLILSRIDARNGAIGIVPSELDGAVVTNDFPLFDLSSERIDAAFLGWLTKTREFVELCQRASEGTTNRVRLQEDRFLALEIALPPLPEQRRIVARIEELAPKIDEAHALQQHAVEEGEAVVASTRRSRIGQAPTEHWIPLQHFVTTIENGRSPQCESRPANADEWGVLKVGALSFGTFDEHENKALPQGAIPDPRFEVQAGDFLMSRANTTELVGACAIVRQTRPKLLLSDKTFRFHFRPNVDFEPHWLDHSMKSPALRQQIERGASGTSSTMKNISKEKVLGLLLPVHSLPEQRRIVAELDALQVKVDALRHAQAETATEVDALMPSILDRAFKGEL
jgi:type I restriction enzyme, S subunit